jgi:RNA polymerase alpha subunit
MKSPFNQAPWNGVIPMKDQWTAFVRSLSGRARNCLEQNGLDSFAKLTAKSPSDLALLRNVGRKTIAEIHLALRRRRLSLQGGVACPHCKKLLPVDLCETLWRKKR